MASNQNARGIIATRRWRCHTHFNHHFDPEQMRNLRQTDVARETGTMREFFRGWRRKIGLATLGLACALMLAWIRSPFFADYVAVHCFGTGNQGMQGVCSLDQHLFWIKTRDADEEDFGFLPNFPALLWPGFHSKPRVLR